MNMSSFALVSMAKDAESLQKVNSCHKQFTYGRVSYEIYRLIEVTRTVGAREVLRPPALQ